MTLVLQFMYHNRSSVNMSCADWSGTKWGSFRILQKFLRKTGDMKKTILWKGRGGEEAFIFAVMDFICQQYRQLVACGCSTDKAQTPFVVAIVHVCVAIQSILMASLHRSVHVGASSAGITQEEGQRRSYIFIFLLVLVLHLPSAVLDHHHSFVAQEAFSGPFPSSTTTTVQYIKTFVIEAIFCGDSIDLLYRSQYNQVCLHVSIFPP